MDKSDLEMEDTKKHSDDVGNNVQESENKVLDTNTESKGEKFQSPASVVEDANRSDEGGEGEDLNKHKNETEEKTTVINEIGDQVNPESETNEPMIVEGSTEEQIDSKSKNEELSNTITNNEEKTADRSSEEKQTGAENEVVEQNGTSGEVKEEKPMENGMEGGNPVENVMDEKSSGDVVEKPKISDNENGDCVEHVAGEEKIIENANAEQSQNIAIGEDKEMEDAANVTEVKTIEDQPKEQGKETLVASLVTDGNTKMLCTTTTEHEGDDSSLQKQLEAATPNSLVKYSPSKAGDPSGGVKTRFTQATLPLMAEGDDGTPEDQAAFMKEIESFYRQRSMDFKPPKFYQQPLNLLKLWRAVLRLGGYDVVTGAKLWRQVGESFHPPKTCTTVSWTFRIFYEKSLLEYERHKRQTGELQLPVEPHPEVPGVDNEGNGYQGSGPGRARRDSAARAMQGWHVQRLFGNGEAGEPVVKDKNLNSVGKREKNLKSIGSLKQKRPNEVEHPAKAARAETSRQLVTSVIDVGPPADWVKINVRQTKDCFEVYALVPGLLREEVRVQSDPAGRLVITGQPEQDDNPWGITSFKKVVSLPARIDPLQTSAVVSLHGRLFVRVPFEQPSV